MNHSKHTKEIAKRKTKNLVHLYLSKLNSSTITSIVAIYRKVPTEMLVNIPSIIGPYVLRAHPIPTPTGFITAYIVIIIVLVFKSTPAALNALPNVNPSAHL
jgi:hypothetical protein